MKEQLEQRLEKLKSEYQSGQKMSADLEGRLAELQKTLMRISGAIQVLEELLEGKSPESAEGAGDETAAEAP